MGLSWLRFRRGKSPSIFERIRAFFLAPILERLAANHEEALARIESVHALSDKVLFTQLQAMSEQLGGIYGLLQVALVALGEMQVTEKDLLYKISQANAGIYGGNVQEWMKKSERGPKDFTFEDRQ